MKNDVKRDVFGRALPPERPARVHKRNLARDDHGRLTEPEREANSGVIENSPVRPPELAPSQVAPEAPAEKPDAGPVVPSQIDPQGPIENDATPTMLEFIQLRNRVEALEYHAFGIEGVETPPSG